MRRRAIAGLSALALGVAALAAIAVCESIGWPFLRAPLERLASRTTAVPVVLGAPFRARLFVDPHLELGHLRVGAGGGVPAPHLIDAQRIRLAWRWSDLWRWRRGDALRIAALRADELDARLVRTADGRATWQLGDASGRAPDARGGAAPIVDRVEVGRAEIGVDDVPLQTKLQVSLSGQEGGADSGYVAKVEGRWRALPLQLAIRSGAALPLIADAGRDTTSALRIEGRAGAATLFFEGRAAALLDARRLDGELRFSGPSLAPVGKPLGLTLPQTPAFDLAGRLAHDDGVWTLRADTARIGASRLGGEFRFDTRFTPPHLGGTLRGSRLLLADLGPSIGASTGGTAERPPPQLAGSRAKVLPQREFDIPSLRAMNADVAVAIDELVFGVDAIGPVRALRTQLTLKGGVLDLQGLQAAVAGGRLNGSTRLDPTGQAARWNADLRFAGVDIDRWLPVLRRAPGADGQRGAPYLTGVMQADVKVAGAGRSTAQILATLDGQAQLALRDATVSHLVTEAIGVDAAQIIGVAIRGDQPLPLRCARFDFEIHNGAMHIRRGVLDNRDSTLRVAGTVDLGKESLGLVARSRPKDFSPFALRTPITVSGSFRQPEVGVDLKRLGTKALGAALLGAVVAPVAALLPLLDFGERDQGDPCAEGAPR